MSLDNFATIENALQTEFVNNYALKNKDVPVMFENENTSEEECKKADVYLKFSVRFSEARRKELGTSTVLRRVTGMIFVQAFSKPNIGTKLIGDILDDVANVFNTTNITEATLRTPYPTRVGNTNGRYVVNLNCPFIADYNA